MHLITDVFFFPLPASVDFQSTVNLTKLNNINIAARYELEGYAGPFLPDPVTTVDAKVGPACSAKCASTIKFQRHAFFFFFSISLSLVGNLGCLSWARHSSCKFLIIMYIYHAVINALSAHIPMCAVFLLVQTVAELPAFHIFNVQTNVDACDCSQSLCKRFIESTLKADWGEKISCCKEESKPCQNCAWLFSSMLCQRRWRAPLSPLQEPVKRLLRDYG